MRPLRFLVALCSVFACGRETSSFHLEVSGAEVTAGGNVPTIEMQTGETRNVELMLVGTVPGGVTFSADGLPPFATLSGPLLTLAPMRADAGEFPLSISAKASGASATTSLKIVVHRQNAAPTWFAGGPFLMADDSGSRFSGICPGPYCTLTGSAKLQLNACDPDGDAVHVDVEVVPRGQPFTGVPAYTAAVACTGAPSFIPLTGLASNQGYALAFRIADEFGAFAQGLPTDANGWMTGFVSPFEFDLGPCTSRQCACVPAGRVSDVVGQCCSGAADPAPPGLIWAPYLCR